MEAKTYIEKRWVFLLLTFFWVIVLFENHILDASSGIIKLSDRLQTGAKAPGLFAFLLIVWAVILLISVVLCGIVDGCGTKDFLVIGLLTGLATIVLVPFAMPIDEVTHFFRAWSISSGHLVQVKTASGLVGDYVPEKLYYVMNKPADSMNLRALYLNMAEWSERLSGRSNAFYENGYAGYYLPIGYFPAAIGLLIARIMNLPLFLMVYVGRFTNFLVYLVVSLIAYRKVPFYKNIFFLAALNPGAIYLACTYSTDGILICSILLFVSICLKYYFAEDVAYAMERLGKNDRAIRKRKIIGGGDITLLIITTAFIASMKTFTYTPILLLFFLIPNGSMSMTKRIGTLIGCIAVLVALGVLQAGLLSAFTYNDTRLATSTDTAGQISYVLKHPIITLRLVMNYLDQHIYYLTGSVKTMQMGAGVEGLARLCAILPIFTVFLTDKRPIGNRKHTKLVVFCSLIYVAEVLLLILSLYVISTDVGGTEIIGVQSRYMLPLLVLLYTTLVHLPIRGNMRDYEGFVGYMTIFSVLTMLVTNLVQLM
ncbi:MAG: DUF2142 domain-containing protein [Lachnospiraceae bacterium]|nr:DUF2142 domain-containing protein [Lachnospiraceae bacterium]